jgi:hypothetical protein
MSDECTEKIMFKHLGFKHSFQVYVKRGEHVAKELKVVRSTSAVLLGKAKGQKLWVKF